MTQENVIKFRKSHSFDLRLKLLKEAKDRYASKLEIRKTKMISNDNNIVPLRVANKELNS